MRRDIRVSTSHGRCYPWNSPLHLKVSDRVCLYCFFRTKCTLLCLICRSVFRRLQAASGLYGMVAVPDKTMLLHPVVGRFTTGAIVRVVQPAEVLRPLPWTLEDNKSCGARFTFDLQRGRSLGTLTVRVCWSTVIYRDELLFAETHFLYWSYKYLLYLTTWYTENKIHYVLCVVR